MKLGVWFVTKIVTPFWCEFARVLNQFNGAAPKSCEPNRSRLFTRTAFSNHVSKIAYRGLHILEAPERSFPRPGTGIRVA